MAVLFWIRVVVVAAVLASAPRANAMCAPAFWVGTPDGSTIPTRGALYVYSNADTFAGAYPDRHRERVPLTIAWNGPPGTAEQSEVSRDVIKVSYRGEAGSQLVLGEGDNAPRYTLADAWRPPANAPTARRLEHDDSHGVCEGWNVLRVTLDQPTAAIRIRWTIAEVTSEWVLPAEENIVEIGERSCGGTTVPADQLAGGGHLELIAIRLDGSELAVTGVPSNISFDDVPTGGVAAEIVYVDVPPEPTPRELPGSGREPVVISLALLVASLGLASWWLRKALARLR